MNEGVLLSCDVLVWRDRWNLMVDFGIVNWISEFLIVGVGKGLSWIEQTGEDVEEGSSEDGCFVEVRLSGDYVPQVDCSSWTWCHEEQTWMCILLPKEVPHALFDIHPGSISIVSLPLRMPNCPLLVSSPDVSMADSPSLFECSDGNVVILNFLREAVAPIKLKKQLSGLSLNRPQNGNRNRVHITCWEHYCLYLILLSVDGWSSMLILLNYLAQIVCDGVGICFLINERSGDWEQDLVWKVVFVSAGGHSSIVERQFHMPDISSEWFPFLFVRDNFDEGLGHFMPVKNNIFFENINILYHFFFRCWEEDFAFNVRKIDVFSLFTQDRIYLCVTYQLEFWSFFEAPQQEISLNMVYVYLTWTLPHLEQRALTISRLQDPEFRTCLAHPRKKQIFLVLAHLQT